MAPAATSKTSFTTSPWKEYRHTGGEHAPAQHVTTGAYAADGRLNDGGGNADTPTVRRPAPATKSRTEVPPIAAAPTRHPEVRRSAPGLVEGVEGEGPGVGVDVAVLGLVGRKPGPAPSRR